MNLAEAAFGVRAADVNDGGLRQRQPVAMLGLDHFGLRVDNIDAAYAELTQRGAVFTVPPRTIRPGVRIAFVQAPDNVRIELLERT